MLIFQPKDHAERSGILTKVHWLRFCFLYSFEWVVVAGKVGWRYRDEGSVVYNEGLIL